MVGAECFFESFAGVMEFGHSPVSPGEIDGGWSASLAWVERWYALL